jgi:hypothetical protein
MQRPSATADFVLFPSNPAENPIDSSDMLALDSSRYQQYSYLQHLPFDTTGMDPVPYHSLDHFQTLYANADGSVVLPSSFYTSSPMYLDDIQKPTTLPPAPSTPSSLATSSGIERIPALSGASGPSVASASSSAIGSPYSAAAQGFPEPCIVGPHYGVGLSPSLDHPDLILTPDQLGNAVDLDALQLPERFSNCVGEWIYLLV